MNDFEPFRPPNTVLPHIFYADVAEAVSWLTGAFGFTEHYRYGDPAARRAALKCGSEMPGLCSGEPAREAPVWRNLAMEPKA